VTSPPYHGLRKYSGEQGERPLGLEDTAEEHIERMVVIFREVYRVLRDDGVCWMNYGDAFDDGNLMMLPHRLAIALQADGWIVRNDLVWFKRNPMPESVRGWTWQDDKLQKGSWRHTRAHEYVFQLVKGMGYYCNQEAVREALNVPDVSGIPFGGKKRAGGDNATYSGNEYTASAGRNPRSVLDVPTAPYKGAHYATFPPKLIAPLIRASVPRRCCPECGMAWAPVVEKGEKYAVDGRKNWGKDKPDEGTKLNKQDEVWNRETPMMRSMKYEQAVTDYRPTCECGVTEHEPGIVLDIFGGSGTTGMVAKQLMRRWVVMDISRPYLDEQAKVRTGTGTPSGALEGLPMFGGEDE